MKQRGFSIIEIAVVLVVIGLMMTTAIPNISSWLRNTKLRNQAEAIQNGLQQARNEAVRRNRTVSFWLVTLPTANSMNNNCDVSASGTSWVVSVSSPDALCASAPSTTTSPMIVTKHVGADGASGVTVSGLQADGDTAASSITFDGFGRASGDLSRVSVSYASASSSDRPLQIDITPSGMVRMCDTTVTADTDPRKCPAQAE